SWRRSTSFGVRYSLSRRSTFRGRRGVTVRFMMVEGSRGGLGFPIANALMRRKLSEYRTFCGKLPTQQGRKWKDQKPAETGGRSGAFIAKFRSWSSRRAMLVHARGSLSFQSFFSIAASESGTRNPSQQQLDGQGARLEAIPKPSRHIDVHASF